MLVCLGLAVSGGELVLGSDGLPFTSLLYGNGGGYQGDSGEPHSRQNLTSVDTGEFVFVRWLIQVTNKKN